MNDAFPETGKATPFTMHLTREDVSGMRGAHADAAEQMGGRWGQVFYVVR